MSKTKPKDPKMETAIRDEYARGIARLTPKPDDFLPTRAVEAAQAIYRACDMEVPERAYVCNGPWAVLRAAYAELTFRAHHGETDFARVLESMIVPMYDRLQDPGLKRIIDTTDEKTFIAIREGVPDKMVSAQANQVWESAMTRTIAKLRSVALKGETNPWDVVPEDRHPEVTVYTLSGGISTLVQKREKKHEGAWRAAWTNYARERAIWPDDGAGYQNWRSFYRAYHVATDGALGGELAPFWSLDDTNPFAWWFFRGMIILLAPPEQWHIDKEEFRVRGRLRLHAPEMPACKWADGFRAVFWRGVNIPAEWVEKRDELDPKMALSERNTELRRVLYEIIGYEKILQSVGGKEIQKDDFGTLIEAQLDDDQGKPARFVRVKCPSTGRVYVNRVNPEHATARAAVASRWRLKSDDWKLHAES